VKRSTRLLALLALATAAQASVIFAPTSGVINTGGPGFGSLANTFNQAGLSAGYVNNVTNFDAYIASGPMHTATFACCEWFSNSGTTAAMVTYDFGSIRTFDRLALWNEESSGIGSLHLLISSDNITYVSLATVSPFDNPLASYPAEVFSVGGTARYVRFDMSGCPQPLPGSFTACAIGEVAFREAVVPEPSSIAMLGIGCCVLPLLLRRRLVRK
jgi:PEP-CTERM motif